MIGCANNTKGEPQPQSTRKGILLDRAYCVVTGGDFEDYKLMRLRIPLAEDGTAREWNGGWPFTPPPSHLSLHTSVHTPIHTSRCG